MPLQQSFDFDVCLLWLVLPQQYVASAVREGAKNRVSATEVTRGTGRLPIWIKRFSGIACFALDAVSGEYSGGMGNLATQVALSRNRLTNKMKVAPRVFKSWETSCARTVAYFQSLLQETWILVYLDPGNSERPSEKPLKAMHIADGAVSIDSLMHWEKGQAALVGKAERRVTESFGKFLV